MPLDTPLDPELEPFLVIDDVEQEDMSAHQASPGTPREARELLTRGNQAFVDGMHHHRPMTEEWRESLMATRRLLTACTTIAP